MKHTHLYIIGNGFDIKHGFPTGWMDYLKWLAASKDYNPTLLYNWLVWDPSFGAKLWSNLEEALGEFDLETMYRYCTQDIEIDYDHMMRSGFGIEDAPKWELAPHLTTLRTSLFDWIEYVTDKHISRSSPNPKLQAILPQDALYLTFNYTPTLQTIYHISDNNICHIHGSMANSDDLIIGHNTIRTHEWDNDSISYFEHARASICDIMNDLYKDTNAIIAQCALFFNLLNNIKQITVIGHSYNIIDLPYFQKIATSIDHICDWHLYYHTDNDLNAAQRLVSTIGIPFSHYTTHKL